MANYKLKNGKFKKTPNKVPIVTNRYLLKGHILLRMFGNDIIQTVAILKL